MTRLSHGGKIKPAARTEEVVRRRHPLVVIQPRFVGIEERSAAQASPRPALALRVRNHIITPQRGKSDIVVHAVP